MEKILKRLDLEASSADTLFYCVDCYIREEYNDAMMFQFEYLRALYDLECIHDDMNEEESELYFSILNWMEGYGEVTIWKPDIPMYKFGTVKNIQEMVNKETKPLAIYLK